MLLCLAGLCAVLLRTWPPTALWPRPEDPGGAPSSPSAHTTSSPVSQSAGEHTTWREMVKIKAVNHQENSTWQHIGLNTATGRCRMSVCTCHIASLKTCTLANDHFFDCVWFQWTSSLQRQVNKLCARVCRSRWKEEKGEESVSLVFFCNDCMHIWDRSTNMAL